MEIKVAEEAPQLNQPLLEAEKPSADASKQQKSPVQKAMRKTFKGTSQLANLLPTGTVLSFQILAPVLTNQGKCTSMSRTMAGCLVALCGLSCFLVSFTDSFRDAKGKVRYGLATFKGLLVMDTTENAVLAEEEASKYRLRFMDFVHAILSVLVFVAVAMFDQNLVQCFCPIPTQETKVMLTGLPVGIGVICSMLFVAFPTKRHGIGFPLSRQ